MPFGFEQDIIGEVDKDSLQAIQKYDNRTFFLGTFKHGAYKQIWRGYAYNDVANPFLFADNLTSTANDKYEPQFQVVGDKVYYVWYSDCGGSRYQIVTGVSGIHGEDFVATQRTSGTGYWNMNPQLHVVGTKIYYTWERAPHAGTLIFQVATAVMNTDGTGWSMATRTSYGTTGGISSLQLQVDSNYIYYVWTKSYIGETRITTAKMHINGSGWVAVERTSGSYDRYVQQHVFNGNIYYVYEKDVYPTEPNYQIWTAKMTTGGAGWSATQRASSAEINPHPQLDIFEGKLQYTYLSYPSAYTQIFTAFMNLDGSGWVASQRTITTDDIKSDPQLDELNYAWMADKGGYWYKNPWLSVPITVATGDPTDIEKNSANGFGVVQTGDDVKRRGFCWNETGNPTINDDNTIEYNTDFGTGNFALAMTGLSSKTKYYVKAFAYDVDYIYGNEVEFTTELAAPTNVQATDGVHETKVVITWTKVSDATAYQVYRDGIALGWLGDVATYDDTGADAPSITLGSTIASDGAHADRIALSLSGSSANNGTTHTYKVKAKDATRESSDSATDTGYCGIGELTYQWYRSAGDSDASYSIISGATASTYNDTNTPAPTITPGAADASDGSSFDYVSLSISGHSANDGDGRYYKCYLTATGATPGYTEVDRGYRGAGSLTYQWQRSAGDSDADYSNISGATSDTHNDTNAPIPTITPGITIASDGAYATHIALSLSGQSADGEGRYYVCVLNADGCDEETSSSDRGYRSVGDLTYQWQRSAADSDVSYSNISSATAATYNDTGAPDDGSGRYYKCVEDATGADQQISASDRGHRITWATVTTQAVSDIGEITAIGNGTITDIGYEHCSKRGVCWNTTGSPTVADDTSEELDDFGTGAFTRLMTGLTENTTYYVKAYAYNSAGYSYGGEVEFTTETAQAATVTTLTPDLVEDGIANLRLALVNKDDLIINPVGWYCDENAAPSTEYIETGWKAGGGGADLALGIYSKYVKTLPVGQTTLYVQAWCDDDSSNRYTGSILSFDIPSKPEYTNLPDIIFPELPEIPAIEIDLPNINYNIAMDLYLDRTYTRKDLEELRQKCINYEKNYTDFCLILNHNTLLVKNFLQSAYNNGVLGGENEMFTNIYPSQQLTPLYLEPLEPNNFKGIINRFINNNTSNSMGLNHNFDLFKEWLNDYNYTSDGYKASYITPKEGIITNNEPTVKYLTGKINRLQREVSMASREITHNFNLMKEIIQ